MSITNSPQLLNRELIDKEFKGNSFLVSDEMVLNTNKL